MRHAARIGDRDKRRQILARRTECVTCPAADGGEAVEREAGAHLVFSGPVRIRFRRHRMDETHLVRETAEVRQQIRGHLAALPARAEFPERLDQVTVLALEGDQFARTRHRHVVTLHQLGLEIERVHVAHRTRTKDHQHAFGFRCEVRRTRRVRPRGIEGGTERRFVRGEQSFLRQQRGECDGFEAATRPAQERPAIQKRWFGEMWIHNVNERGLISQSPLRAIHARCGVAEYRAAPTGHCDFGTGPWRT